MFDEMNEALKNLNETTKNLSKSHERRLIMWITEMSLKYNKKPKEIIEMLNDVVQLMTTKRTQNKS